VIFVLLRRAFNLRLGKAASYETRDRVFANYGPFSLLLLLQSWLIAVYGGFALADGAVADHGVREALRLSGSSLFTLGFDGPSGAGTTFLTFLEASIGLLLVALLISYLPTIYGAFSRREAFVNKLEVRASPPGAGPPDGCSMLIRAWNLERFEQLSTLWVDLESWFVDIEETHTSFPVLVFFRSPHPDLSWITAAGAILDGAALQESTLDVGPSVEARLCLRAGSLALRKIADFYRITYDPDPPQNGPISISHDDWLDAVARLRSEGLPIRADLAAAWLDFNGWRVNYDRVLVAIATLVQAPYALWSSDRSLAEEVIPPMFLRHPHESVRTRRS
jgi:hypothetical protein